MACNGCTKKFGLFLKEHGCPSCKYSFCSKCLKFRIKIDGKSKDVCLRCSELSKTTEGAGGSPKKNSGSEKIDLTILDAPAEPLPKAVVIEPVKIPEPKTEDELIRERLAALKQKDNDDQDATTTLPDDAAATGTSLTDIEKRLAALKGVEYKDYSEANKKFLLQKDGRSEEQQITDLMKQFAEEQEIQESVEGYRLAAIDDIEKRLAALKDVPTAATAEGEQGAKASEEAPLAEGEESDEENENEAASRIAARYLEEAAIEAKRTATKDDDEDELNNLDIPTPLDPAETEELPWCTICNEDAVIRCVGCDGDLFCRGCFREIHDDDEDYRRHETKPYKANPKRKS